MVPGEPVPGDGSRTAAAWALAPCLAFLLACSTVAGTSPAAGPPSPSAPESGEETPSAQAVTGPPCETPPSGPTSVVEGVFTAAQAERGLAAYAQHCAECHGDELGGGEMAPGLVGVAFRFRWRGLTVADIFDSVESTMPPDEPGTLGDQACADVVAYLLDANGYPAGDRELTADLDSLRGLAVEPVPP